MMADAELPRAARLRRAADFAALRRARGRIRGRFFMLRYETNTVAMPRLGLAVSRRVSLRAVERNRIKRQIRESFRHRRAQLPPVDILVIAQRAAAGQAGERLRADLDALWGRVRPLKQAGAPGTMTG